MRKLVLISSACFLIIGLTVSNLSAQNPTGKQVVKTEKKDAKIVKNDTKDAKKDVKAVKKNDVKEVKKTLKK